MAISKIKFWSLLLFFILTLFLSLNRHSKSGIQNYHSEIWADKAGYYIYLPSFFIYDFKAEKLPTDIEKKTGDGFLIKEGKIITKYSYGVALMQSPFFLTFHYVSKIFGLNDDGFGIQYHKAIDVAAVVYTFFAFVILYSFLARYLSNKTSIITLVCLYLGTNVFYYSIFETGMSHIYSFFLFACFLYLGPYISKGGSILHYCLFGLVVGLIIVVRPFNILFIPVYFIFNTLSISDIKNNIKGYLIAISIAFLIVLPQLIYWNYAFGNYFQYSYGNESFSHILQPKLIQMWFSTKNGFFLYNPIVVFILTGLFFLYKKMPTQSILITIYFIVLSYIFSSWHDWGYGCSYGCRPYVEYYTMLSLPFGFFINKLDEKTFYQPFLITFIVVFIVYNLKLIFSYDGCWLESIWNWAKFSELLLGPTK